MSNEFKPCLHIKNASFRPTFSIMLSTEDATPGPASMETTLWQVTGSVNKQNSGKYKQYYKQYSIA